MEPSPCAAGLVGMGEERAALFHLNSVFLVTGLPAYPQESLPFPLRLQRLQFIFSFFSARSTLWQALWVYILRIFFLGASGNEGKEGGVALNSP